MMKDYKEPPDRPFEEIPVPDEYFDRLEEKDGMFFESDEKKRIRKRDSKLKSRISKIVIKCLHRYKEKRIFILWHIRNKPLWEVAKRLKMTSAQISRIVKNLDEKLPKIYQSFQLFKNLKEKLKDNLTQAEYEAFELHYNQWMSYEQIRKKLNLVTKAGIKFRIKNGERKLKDALEKEDWEQYLQLKEIRRT